LCGNSIATDIIGGDGVSKVQNFDVFVGRVVDNVTDDGDNVGGYFFGYVDVTFVV